MPQNKKKQEISGNSGQGAAAAGANGNSSASNNSGKGDKGSRKSVRCCVPKDCLYPGKPIYLDEIGKGDVVKVICNNGDCEEGEWMHKDCFDNWEVDVLSFLKSCGRARSWSEKQRIQNLWTKKGYDLSFKACGCKCGKGHLKKDLDWFPPVKSAPIQVPQGEGKKKKKSLPTLSISAPVHHPNNNHMRNRNDSISATSGAIGKGAPAPAPSGPRDSNGSLDFSSVAANALSRSGAGGRQRYNSVSSVSSGSGSSGSPPSPENWSSSPGHGQTMVSRFLRRNSSNGDGEYAMERVRRDSGGSGFSRRIDFSAFNKLPRHKRNSIHIKMEEKGFDGSGEAEMRRNIHGIFSTLHMNRINCILCKIPMNIFEKFPLLDGTLFMSPTRHSSHSVKVNRGNEGDGCKPSWLSGVCMACLEGVNGILSCKSCGHAWDGSDLVIGTCYNWDIFAASPCCPGRLTCSDCGQLIMFPNDRPSYFSEYSQPFLCPFCNLMEFHLARPVEKIFNKTK